MRSRLVAGVVTFVVSASLIASCSLTSNSPDSGIGGNSDSGLTDCFAANGRCVTPSVGCNATEHYDLGKTCTSYDTFCCMPGNDSGISDAGPASLRVLFIGNSYTYVNDLPGMLAKIASTAGVPPTITTDEVVQGGAALQDHWNNGIAQARINERQWTHVVLQGQSVEAAESSDDYFSAAAQQFGKLIVAANARPSLFVTWARAAGVTDAGDTAYNPLWMYWFSPDEMQDLITFNYVSVARQMPGSILSCVGEAFRSSLRNHPEIVLHQSDLSHPTVAGTYLAASTFYVALTASPVPPVSEVPDGLSLLDAQVLREEALVGANCAGVPPKKANVVMEDCAPCQPFDFGTAGTSIPNIFIVENIGVVTAGLTDGMTLAPPFSWTSGAYPGGSGTTSSSGFQFCSASLPSGVPCALSVSYAGSTEGSGTLTLNVTDAYSANLVRELHGSPTTRALLAVSEDAGFFGCTDTSCANTPAGVTAIEGLSMPLSLVVSNRGGAPTTTLGVGAALNPPFYWGPGGTTGTFPGGSGTGEVGGVAYDYCTTQTLGAGQQCIVTVVFSPVAGDTQLAGVVNVAYSDAQGPVLPNANRNLQGTSVPVCPPGSACMGPCDTDGELCSTGYGSTMTCSSSPDAGLSWKCYLP